MPRNEVEQLVKDEVARQVKELAGNFFIDKYLVERDMSFNNGRDISFGRTTGTKIGTGTDQKLSFYGVTPVDQPITVADASGCAGNADDKVNELIDRLQELGLIA